MLARMQRELEFRLAHLPTTADESFNEVQLHVMLRQVRVIMRDFTPRFRRLLVDQSKFLASRAAKDVLTYMAAAERRYRGVAIKLPLDVAMMMDRAVQQTESSILHRLSVIGGKNDARGVLQRYSVMTIRKIEEQLFLGLALRKSTAEMVMAVRKASIFLKGSPRWMAERVVRTELMGAYNRAAVSSIQYANRQLGDVVKVLVMIDDERTAADSYAVNGEVRRPEELFDTWQGRMMNPPARPNDRETVVPHRMSWPWPEAAFRWRTDAEVEARYIEEGRTGEIPPRPKRSTVALRP